MYDTPRRPSAGEADGHVRPRAALRPRADSRSACGHRHNRTRWRTQCAQSAVWSQDDAGRGSYRLYPAGASAAQDFRAVSRVRSTAQGVIGAGRSRSGPDIGHVVVDRIPGRAGRATATGRSTSSGSEIEQPRVSVDDAAQGDRGPAAGLREPRRSSERASSPTGPSATRWQRKGRPEGRGPVHQHLSVPDDPDRGPGGRVRGRSWSANHGVSRWAPGSPSTTRSTTER